MRSLSLKLAAVLVAVLSALTLTAVPANAATTAWNDCPSGYFCAWSEDGATGRFAKWEFDDSNWTDDLMHDDADSLFNNGTAGTYDDVAVYTDVDYRNYSFCVPNGEKYDWYMNDNEYDSHLWRSGC
ncbi:peptidase inhibitor family I36 protein [Kribbella sp. CA-253562]|uniref:peptidase inhibitor family I36 protein n=1 Tax=Kribbella sp. CA-253562 TaxID=3239942 RepID=UPI003D8DF9A4